MYGAPDSWILKDPEAGCDWHDYYDDGDCPDCMQAEDYTTEQIMEYLRGE
jgi:hypothetical protein